MRLMHSILGHPLKNKAKTLWKCVVKTILWEAWFGGNHIIFNGPIKNLCEIYLVLFTLFLVIMIYIFFYYYFYINANWRTDLYKKVLVSY